MDSLANIDWVDMLIKVGSALAIIIVTAIIAMLVKAAITKLAGRVPALNQPGVDGPSLGNSLGTIASLVIWLLGLIAVLGIFQLNGVLSPVTSMLDKALSYIPNIIGAVFVFIIGLTIAKVVRALIQTALGSFDFSRIMGGAKSSLAKVGAPEAITGGSDRAAHEAQPDAARNLPSIIANVVFGLIMIVVSIAALHILGIAAISEPAQQMLTRVFDAIPNIIAAAILLGIGVVIARFASSLLGQVLAGMDVDGSLRKGDVLPEGRSVTPIITRVVEIAIVLFFAVMAAQMLGFPQITAILTDILALAGRIVFGAVIIAAGFFIANFLAKMLSGQTAVIVKYVTIVLFVAMGLKSMGVADSIIEMAFGALVIGAAAAGVLAFGLGGREAAARQLAKLEKKSEKLD